MKNEKYSVTYCVGNAKENQDLVVFKQDDIIPRFVYEQSDRNEKSIISEMWRNLNKDILYADCEYKTLL